jgi:hypothetical protein
MKWICVAAVLVGVSGAAAADDEWRIDPPPGWRRNPALEDKFARARPTRSLRTALQLWVAADLRGMLMVDWFVVDAGQRPTREVIDLLDSTTLNGGNATDRKDVPERTIGTMIVRDSTGISAGAPARQLRYYQPASDGLHAVTAMCTATDMALCHAALDSLRLTVAGALPAPAREEGKPTTYRVGQILAIVGVLALTFGLALVLHRQSQRRRLERRRALSHAPAPAHAPAPEHGGVGDTGNAS